MKDCIKYFGIFVIVFCLMEIGIGAEESAGKELFLKYKCNLCHSVSALNIPVEEEEEEVAVEEGEEELEAPDLSGVGNNYTAEWIELYLRKKENIEGRKHKKRFKGPKNDRLALMAWLASQKQDVSAEK